MVLHIIRADILQVAWYFSESRRGEEKYEQWAKCPPVLCVKPSNKRFIIPLQKKVCYFWLLFSGKRVEIHPALSVHQYIARANDVNNTKSQWNVFIRISSVVNRSNWDTTVYYGLIFCAFYWPYLVKWSNSRTIGGYCWNWNIPSKKQISATDLWVTRFSPK